MPVSPPARLQVLVGTWEWRRRQSVPVPDFECWWDPVARHRVELAAKIRRYLPFLYVPAYLRMHEFFTLRPVLLPSQYA